MALSTVVGSSGSGKSTYLYNRIIEESILNKDKQYLIIVPEQYTMSTQRMLVAMHPKHCIMNIDVLSFNRLAYRVFEELGLTTLGILDDTGKTLVLRKLVSDCYGSLKALQKNMTRLSYITQVKSLISEMTQYNITPDILRQMIAYGPMSESFRLKAADLLTMYEAFLDFIDGRYVTTESILSQLNEVLDDSKMLQDAVVVLDGFTGFTPIQYQLVEHFLKITEEVYVSITADPADSLLTKHRPDELFEMSADFMQRLVKISTNAGVEIKEPVLIDGAHGRLSNSKVLAHIENHIFRNDRVVYEGDDAKEAIKVCSIKNPRQELRYAAITISKLIRTGNYFYKDFAIVCPDIESYRYVIDGIFKEYDIPYFVDAKTEILYHPFVEFLDGIFEIFDTDFNKDSVFRFLRAGFTSLTVDEIDILENYIISTGLRGKKKYFHPFAIRSNTFKEDDDLVKLNAIKDKFIHPFMDFDKTLDKSSTVKDIALGLYAFIVYFDCQNKIRERGLFHEKLNHGVKSKEYSQIYKVVLSLMDKMVSILGDEIMPLEDFYDVFKAGLSSASIGIIPPDHDSVILGDMERTRLDGIKVLFLVGASDAAIPKKVETGGILSQLEREQLLEAFEMAPSDRQKVYRQRFYLYMMLCEPSEQLIVTAPRVDSSGKAVRTSYLVDMLLSMFSKVKLTVIEEFDQEDSAISFAGAKDLLIHYIKLSARDGIESLSEQDRDYFTKLIAWAKASDVDIKALIDTAFYRHEPEFVSSDVMLMVNEAFNHDETVSGSVSKFEDYASCAYKYFLDYILRLKPREEYELSYFDMGNFYHCALENFGKLLKDDSIMWGQITAEQIDVYIDSAIQITFENMKKVSTLEDPAQRYIVDSMKHVLKHTVTILTEQIKRSTFEPELFEYGIKTELDDGITGEVVASLKGQIDRIDIAQADPKGQTPVRIIDYKSSAHKLDLNACYYGLSLQLPIYMGVVLDKLSDKYSSLKPSAMLYFKTKDPFVESKLSGASLQEERMSLLKMDGLVASGEDNIFANDKTLSIDNPKSATIPVTLKKDGLPDSRSSVIEDVDMETLIKYSRLKAAELAQDIIAGKFDCRPNDASASGACTYCDYRAVCHFDENVDGFEKNEMPDLEKNALPMMAERLRKKGDKTVETD